MSNLFARVTAATLVFAIALTLVPLWLIGCAYHVLSGRREAA